MGDPQEGTSDLKRGLPYLILTLYIGLIFIAAANARSLPPPSHAQQMNWRAWLPDKWRRIAVCETGLNWRHHNSSYQGAFGFATSSWDQFKPRGYPADADQATPWQQYQVALAIYRRYGLSGWGCRNA